MKKNFVLLSTDCGYYGWIMYGFASFEEAKTYFLNNQRALEARVGNLLALDASAESTIDADIALVEIKTISDIIQIATHSIENWEEGFLLFYVERIEKF